MTRRLLHEPDSVTTTRRTIRMAKMTPDGSVPAASAEQPLRVLLIDDHRDTAEMLGTFLERSGCRTTICHSLAAARERLSESWDVVISDLGLSDGSGLEVARHFAGASEKPRMIALTGWSSAADRDATRAAGFDEHLVKPIDLKALLAVLRG